MGDARKNKQMKEYRRKKERKQTPRMGGGQGPRKLEQDRGKENGKERNQTERGDANEKRRHTAAGEPQFTFDVPHQNR